MMTRDKEIDIIYGCQQQETKTTTILKFVIHVQIRAKTEHVQYDCAYFERLSKTKLLPVYFREMNDFT